MLNQGKSVRALVRQGKNINPHPNLEVIYGDALNKSDLEKISQEVVGVFSLLGHSKRSPERLLANSMSKLLQSYQRQIVTMAGVRSAEDTPGLFDRFVNLLLKKLSRKEYSDWYELEKVLRISKSEWTIVRAPRIINGQGEETLVGHVGDARLKAEIGVGESSQFLCSLAGSCEYLHKTPYVARIKI